MIDYKNNGNTNLFSNQTQVVGTNSMLCQQKYPILISQQKILLLIYLSPLYLEHLSLVINLTYVNMHLLLCGLEVSKKYIMQIA